MYIRSWKTDVRTKFDPSPIFVNKVALEYSHARLYIAYSGCLCTTKVNLSSGNKDHMARKA